MIVHFENCIHHLHSELGFILRRRGQGVLFVAPSASFGLGFEMDLIVCFSERIIQLGFDFVGWWWKSKVGVGRGLGGMRRKNSSCSWLGFSRFRWCKAPVLGLLVRRIWSRSYFQSVGLYLYCLFFREIFSFFVSIEYWDWLYLV